MATLRNTLAAVALLGAAVVGAYLYRKRDRVLPAAAPRATRYEIRIDARALSLGGTKVCDLPPMQDQAGAGAAACKDPGKKADLYYLDALGRALPALSDAAALHEAEIELDPATPYRVLIEVLYTLGQHGVESESVSVADGPGGDRLTYSYALPPSRGGKAQTPPQLVVILRQAGTSLRLETGTLLDKQTTRIGPGCVAGNGVTFASSNPVDYAGLVRCVLTLQGQVRGGTPPSGALEEARFTASPDQPALSVLRVMSALSCGSETCLRARPVGRQTLLALVIFGVPKESEEQDEERSPHENQAVIASLSAPFAQCYTRAWPNPKRRGEYHAALRLELGETGKVERVTVEPAEPAQPNQPARLTSCLQNVAKTAQFPAGRRQTLRVPLSFEPSN